MSGFDSEICGANNNSVIKILLTLKKNSFKGERE
jgi:hypothetical protein